MELSEDQKTHIANWIDAGETLAQIQKRITEEWNIPLTYMEARFLVDDLGLNFAKEEKPAAPEPKAEEGASDLEPVGGVQVEVDKLTRPGTVASGQVVFSDGKSAAWQVDPLGRLGLIPKEEGYRPSEEDLQEFQVALQQQLKPMGS
tara:strand:+ start:31883 stop:32323 length:441 start_codon:yes stop_codon:yes gene_type:complete